MVPAWFLVLPLHLVWGRPIPLIPGGPLGLAPPGVPFLVGCGPPLSHPPREISPWIWIRISGAGLCPCSSTWTFSPLAGSALGARPLASGYTGCCPCSCGAFPPGIFHPFLCRPSCSLFVGFGPALLSCPVFGSNSCSLPGVYTCLVFRFLRSELSRLLLVRSEV